MNLWTIFATGLFTGGLSCLAVQGGLLAATIAQREEERLKDKTLRGGNAFPILSFLMAKLAAYSVLGFLLGLFGSLFQLSISAKIILQLAVSVFMIGTALNLLHVHPIFRYFIIQPPKFLTRLIRNQAKSKDFFAPALLGAFTIFIPCGTTQAMMAFAVGSASPWLGATIMFVFVMGTSPTFFLLGYLASKLGSILDSVFMRVAAYAIILLAIFNINGAVALAGSNFTLENLWREIDCTVLTFCDRSKLGITAGTVAGSAVEEATINLESSGYNPDYIAVKAGSQVTLHLVNSTGKGCIQSFTIPKLDIQKVIPVGNSTTVQFTAPSKQTDLAFMCGMGMFRGIIHVIENTI